MGHACSAALLTAWFRPDLLLKRKGEEEYQQQQLDHDVNNVMEEIKTSIDKEDNNKVPVDNIRTILGGQEKKQSSMNFIAKLMGKSSSSSSSSSTKTAASTNNHAPNRENVQESIDVFEVQRKRIDAEIENLKEKIKGFEKGIIEAGRNKHDRIEFATKIKKLEARLKTKRAQKKEKEDKIEKLEDFLESLDDVHDAVLGEVGLEKIRVDPDEMAETVERLQDNSGMDRIEETMAEAKNLSPTYYDHDREPEEEDDAEVKSILDRIDAEQIKSQLLSPPTSTPKYKLNTTTATSTNNINNISTLSHSNATNDRNFLYTKTSDIPDISALDD